jgi:hypothetical protein
MSLPFFSSAQNWDVLNVGRPAMLTELVVTIPTGSNNISDHYKHLAPVTVAERSKACTVFARSETGIVGSNPTQDMDVYFAYVRFSVFVYR